MADLCETRRKLRIDWFLVKSQFGTVLWCHFDRRGTPSRRSQFLAVDEAPRHGTQIEDLSLDQLTLPAMPVLQDRGDGDVLC